MHDHPPHPYTLEHDLHALAAQLQRRRALAWLAGAGVAGLVGCGGGGDAAASSSTTSTGTTTTGAGGTTTTTPTTTTPTPTTPTPTSSASCTVIPEETQGPYPADGSNTSAGGISDALMLSGIVRSDIRASIAGAGGVAAGVPLTLTLQLVDTNAACASLAGYAIYVWHCNRDGGYSLYTSGITNENYLRGVQSTDADGKVAFTTIFPACYSGRMPHIHFEIYRSANTATSYTNKLKTSQLALPTDVCSTVYTTAAGYSASIANLAHISFATDNVFSDGVSTQLASVTGSVAAGYVASLVVGIAV